MEQTAASLLDNLGLLHHVQARLELLVAQRLLVARPLLLLKLFHATNKVANELQRLPVRTFLGEGGVDEAADVVEPGAWLW